MNATAIKSKTSYDFGKMSSGLNRAKMGKIKYTLEQMVSEVEYFGDRITTIDLLAAQFVLEDMKDFDSTPFSSPYFVTSTTINGVPTIVGALLSDVPYSGETPIVDMNEFKYQLSQLNALAAQYATRNHNHNVQTPPVNTVPQQQVNQVQPQQPVQQQQVVTTPLYPIGQGQPTTPAQTQEVKMSNEAEEQDLEAAICRIDFSKLNTEINKKTGRPIASEVDDEIRYWFHLYNFNPKDKKSQAKFDSLIMKLRSIIPHLQEVDKKVGSHMIYSIIDVGQNGKNINLDNFKLQSKDNKISVYVDKTDVSISGLDA